jgi:hypothetical protein
MLCTACHREQTRIWVSELYYGHLKNNYDRLVYQYFRLTFYRKQKKDVNYMYSDTSDPIFCVLCR